jgi:hypothetical protein
MYTTRHLRRAFFLNDDRCPGRVTRHGTANTGVVFVLPRVTHHLGHDAAATPQGTANIFAARTVLLFRNLVALSDGLAGAAERVQGPGRKQQVTKESEPCNVDGALVSSVRHGSDFECGGVDEKGNDQQ